MSQIQPIQRMLTKKAIKEKTMLHHGGRSRLVTKYMRIQTGIDKPAPIQNPRGGFQLSLGSQKYWAMKKKIVPKNGNVQQNGLNHISSAGGGIVILHRKSNGASMKTHTIFCRMLLSLNFSWPKRLALKKALVLTAAQDLFFTVWVATVNVFWAIDSSSSIVSEAKLDFEFSQSKLSCVSRLSPLADSFIFWLSSIKGSSVSASEASSYRYHLALLYQQSSIATNTINTAYHIRKMNTKTRLMRP